MNVVAFILLIIALVLLAIAALYTTAVAGAPAARRTIAFFPAGVFLLAAAWGVELLTTSRSVHF